MERQTASDFQETYQPHDVLRLVIEVASRYGVVHDNARGDYSCPKG